MLLIFRKMIGIVQLNEKSLKTIFVDGENGKGIVVVVIIDLFGFGERFLSTTLTSWDFHG